ncbi:erythromycin esterase family protein [Nonomuraea sp. NPDC049646]|uniref:erythromycin esterase family protein n=1 Tax=unclassified Nonomuraea TaxID=2593643 RepID=UPI0037BC2665
MANNTVRRIAPITLALAACLATATTPALATPATAAPAQAGPVTAKAVTVTAVGGRVDDGVVASLERHAKALRSTRPGGQADDLRALSAMVKGATIVGVGEATHGSKELFTLRHRLFRHLVETRGFTTLALEATWSAGARLDEYVRTGKGDLRKILAEEFQNDYGAWRTREWAELYEWMRDHNRTARHKLRVMGFDIGDVHPDQYRRVLAWAAQHRPALVPELSRRYKGLMALPGSTAGRMAALAAMPAQRLKALAADAEAAHRLLEGADPYVAQEAKVISQMVTMYTLEPPKLHLHRDKAMADNTVWWQRHTGGKTVVAAHNGHVGYVSAFPQHYPITQGAYLRSQVGASYVAIGTTIHSGRFRAVDPKTGRVGVFDTGAPVSDSNEAVLDRVRHRDYYADLRQARRTPSVRAWLDAARPTFTVPATYVPEQLNQPLALGRAYDIVAHLHRVTEARPLS